MGFPGKNTQGGCHCLLQGIFPILGWNLSFFASCIDWWILYHYATWEALRSLLCPLLNQQSAAAAFLLLFQTITNKLLDWGIRMFLWVCCCVCVCVCVCFPDPCFFTMHSHLLNVSHHQLALLFRIWKNSKLCNNNSSLLLVLFPQVINSFLLIKIKLAHLSFTIKHRGEAV